MSLVLFHNSFLALRSSSPFLFLLGLFVGGLVILLAS